MHSWWLILSQSHPHTQTIDQPFQFEEESSNTLDSWNEKAINKVHALMMTNALVAYQDHYKWFGIYTDASDFQLGVWFVQDCQPVTYFYCNLSKSQKNYTLMEKDMLSIVATLEEFRHMSWYIPLCVFFWP